MKSNTRSVVRETTVQAVLFPEINNILPSKNRIKRNVFVYGAVQPKKFLPGRAYLDKAALARGWENRLPELLQKELLVSWVRGLCNAAAIFELDCNTAAHQLDLYIILAAQEECGFKELEPFIRTATLGQWNVQFSLCQLALFNQRRKQGSLFHITRCNESGLLYRAKNIQLEHPEEASVHTGFVQREADFKKAQAKGLHFFDTAIVFERDKENALACFALHQAIEITLRGFVAVFSGICPRNHSLKQLFLLCNRIQKGFASFFESTAELDALACLQEAYTGGRYNPDFLVTDALLQLLRNKTENILAFANHTCKEQLSKYALLLQGS